MKIERIFAIFATMIIFGSLALSACSAPNLIPQIAEVPPHIRGEITKVIPLDNGDTLILVVSQEPSANLFASAEITIRPYTHVYQRGMDGYQSATVKDLAAGQTVEALFTGPVGESSPAIATASEVVIVAVKEE